MRNLFFFDAMLTPKIITVLYWLLLASALIGGLSQMFSQYGSFWTGLLTLVGGAVGARMRCELVIVLLKMNAALQDLRRKQADGHGAGLCRLLRRYDTPSVCRTAAEEYRMTIQWWYWLVAGVLLMLLELAIPSFFVFWFGLGALLVALLMLVVADLSLTLQLL